MTIRLSAGRGLAAPRESGFTLIELMIVVVILGVIAAIAIPAYDRQILRSHRSAAQQYLIALASKQEQYMLDARSYSNSTATLNAGTAATDRYDFAIDTAGCAPQPCFTITAAPKAAFPKQQADGNLTINNLGQKTGTWTSS